MLPKGHLIAHWHIICGICGESEDLDFGTYKEAVARARKTISNGESDWSLTKKHGWVCLACLEHLI